jgi:hypothetical protein
VGERSGHSSEWLEWSTKSLVVAEDAAQELKMMDRDQRFPVAEVVFDRPAVPMTD